MGFRWAFNAATWHPTQDEFALALSCVQPEEQERISRFVFQRDAKLALAGIRFFPPLSDPAKAGSGERSIFRTQQKDF